MSRNGTTQRKQVSQPVNSRHSLLLCCHPPPATSLISLLCAVSVLVNAECSQLSAASLDCQNSLQRRGVHQQVAMQQCQSSVEAYKQCKARKTRIESRRGWFEIQREKMKQQQQATGNT